VWFRWLSRLSFTALFEALAIDGLQQASVSALATTWRISWDSVVEHGAARVRRGLRAACRSHVEYVGVGRDELPAPARVREPLTSDTRAWGGGWGRVLYVGDDRTQASLTPFSGWGSRAST